MKTVLLLLAAFIFSNTYSQELNIGGFAGIGPKTLNTRIIVFGGSVEFWPIKARVSLNADPFLVILPDETLLTTPVYLKLILGDKVRFCPAFGGFIRTNANYGWKAGLSLECKIRKSLTLFGMADYYKDFYKTEAPNHFGSGSYYTDSGSSFWISIGIKKNILK